MAAKGIHIDLATLRRQWQEKNSSKSQEEIDREIDFADEEDELIDVVGSEGEDESNSSVRSDEHKSDTKKSIQSRKSFSIDSLLFSKERSQQ